MALRRFRPPLGTVAMIALVPLLAAGCLTSRKQVVFPHPDVPHETRKVAHPAYVVEPPDILQIDLISAVPKTGNKLRTLDVLAIKVDGVEAIAPIEGLFTVDPEGLISLGQAFNYGPPIKATNYTIQELVVAIEKQIRMQGHIFKSVKVDLAQTRGTQQIRGPHLVRADGTVSLGSYGQVYVTGMTVPEVKTAVENHLKGFFGDAEVSVDVTGYNSKVFYVVFDFGGAGQQVITLPSLGNETVLDGIGRSGGLPTVADSRSIWVSRPGGDRCTPEVLPVDWTAIVKVGDARTNYQIMPGDRVFVKAYDLVEADNALARVIAPIERLFGIVLLGTSTVNNIRRNPNSNNGLGP